MKIKHKLLSDYQYITPDKKIFLIKSGTIIEEYQYKLKGENIPRPGVPESFNVLVHELRGLGLDLTFE
jgi:DNA-directed RNA polymerase subunit beta